MISPRLPANDNLVLQQRIMTFLIGYRWLSLLLPLLTLVFTGERPLLFSLFSAAAVTLFISLFARPLNRNLRHHPWLLLVDLAFMTLLILFTGGWRSPFYLHSLNPLLIAAFYFGVRGAILSSALLSLMVLGADFAAARYLAEPAHWLIVMSSTAGFFLISGTFGYASSLLHQLSRARDEQAQAHHNLEVLHRLTVSLQSAVDIEDVQEKVLAALTTDVGCRRAALGLVNAEGTAVTGWLGKARAGDFADKSQIFADQVHLDESGGLIAQAVQEGCSYFTTSGFGVENAWLSERCGIEACRITPLLVRERPLGVLLVDADDEDAESRLPLLEAIAGQTAVTINGMQTRINRARETAVQEERLRIAQDLHDSVSQSLFGIVYTLDGCLRLLPENSEEAIPELQRALETAQTVRTDIRQSILDLWPSTLTAERFTQDLQAYALNVCQIEAAMLEFDIRGDFGTLSPGARRSLYRITQEALNNIAQHAAATEARICLDIAGGQARLVIRDNGRGFDTAVALNRPFDREHFGLQGIRQRTQALGGECHIFSKPNAGTSIAIDIPV